AAKSRHVHRRTIQAGGRPRRRADRRAVRARRGHLQSARQARQRGQAGRRGVLDPVSRGVRDDPFRLPQQAGERRRRDPGVGQQRGVQGRPIPVRRHQRHRIWRRRDHRLPRLFRSGAGAAAGQDGHL
ncbi:MAG: hypothetical protein AVDCRST_MAG91-426, partial [uncultured Sphingomonadaceae bacterium]